jgi:hypothetical protein
MRWASWLRQEYPGENPAHTAYKSKPLSCKDLCSLQISLEYLGGGHAQHCPLGNPWEIKRSRSQGMCKQMPHLKMNPKSYLDI